MIPEKYLFLGLVFVGTLLEVSGDVMFKKWALEEQNRFLIIGLIVYFAGAVPWAFSLKHADISEAIVVFMVLNVVGALLAGAVIFHDVLTDIQKVGVLFGIVSIILIEL